MIHTILDEIKGKILDLQYVERYGGIVVPVSQDVEDEDGRSKRITFPASWDGQGRACYAANDYFELAPNDVYRSVSYWELRGDAVPFVPRRGDRGKWYGFRQSARLVVWLNLQVLGIPETGNKLSDHLSVLAMNALQGAHQVGVDYIDGVRMTVERKVRKSMDIFGPYSYSDRNELLLYPYDFFAIDFAVEWYIRRDCVPGEVPYKALKCAPIEMPGGGAWTPGGGDECNCRWIDIPDRPHRLSEFENDGDGENPFITANDIPAFVESVGGSDGVEVDDTDPQNPIAKLTQGSKDSLEKADSAVQPGDLADVATSGDYDDLLNKPVIPDSLDDLSGTSDDITEGISKLFFTLTERNKLNGIEANADVTDATNAKAAGATMNTDTDVSGNSWVLDEDDMASDSDEKVPTQQSVKAYTDAKAKGVILIYDAIEDLPIQGEENVLYSVLGRTYLWGTVWCDLGVYVWDEGEYGDVSELPVPGVANTLYYVDDNGTDRYYVWGGAQYVEVEESEFMPAGAADPDAMWKYVEVWNEEIEETEYHIVSSTCDGYYETGSNLFTQDLTLSQSRMHDLNGNDIKFIKGRFEIENDEHVDYRASVTIDERFVAVSSYNRNTFLLAGFTADRDRLRINDGTANKWTHLNIPLKNVVLMTPVSPYTKAEWHPLTIPEYATDTDADNDPYLYSGAPYSLTGDRTVYRKP